MRITVLALPWIATAFLAGCSQNAELQQARAEAKAALAELEQVKTELALLKQQRAEAENKSKSTAATEAAVRNAARAFFVEVRKNLLRSVYEEFLSVAHKKRMDRKGFDGLVEKIGVFRYGEIEDAAFKVRKLAKDNVYECECASRNMGTAVMRLIHEDGAWKIDEFVELPQR